MSRLSGVFIYGFATLGALLSLLLVVGVVVDYNNFDQTSGGYNPPYTNYTGQPINWDETYTTDTGMFSSGIVVNTHVDCTSGMISYEIFGQKFDFRELSPRALAVHNPREACVDRGFEPAF